MLFGGIGVAVVVILIVVMSGGGDKEKANAGTAPAAVTPAAAPTPAPAPAVAEGAKAGKPPEKPAPPLSAETLQKARELLAAATALSNEGTKARTAGNNEEARTKQSAASDKVEALKAMTKVNWDWQEHAEMGDWALPAEYVALGNLYTSVSKLENQIRKGGGTR
jgi:hypothetical protein